MSEPQARCEYCGAPIKRGKVCGSHQQIARTDPNRGAQRGNVSETAYGVRPGWPEQEAEDDGPSE